MRMVRNSNRHFAVAPGFEPEGKRLQDEYKTDLQSQECEGRKKS